MLLAGCEQGPLSTLAPASAVTRSVAALWWTMAAGTGVVLVLMVVLAALAMRRNSSADPAGRGVRTLLVAGGLMLPASVIAALLVFGLKLDEAQWPPGVRAEADRAFHVDVVAHQWWWEFRYMNAEGSGAAPPPTTNVLHVPAGVPVHLRIMAVDVIHGFWVPRIAGKLDAVPGRVNRLRILVEEPGEYAGICAEYCGDGHTGMRFTLVAHPPDVLAQRLAELSGEGRP